MRALVCALLLVAESALAGDRVALLVSSDVGLPTETPLRFTSKDAERMTSVLTELGNFRKEDVVTLVGANAEQIIAGLEKIANATQKPELFLFYYSGHADSASLHPEGTRLPVDELLERIRHIPAQLQIGLIDACHSGSATQAKGVRPAATFDVRMNPLGGQGQVLITSSAADEQSFESDAQRGALFTINWTAGLRGAADKDDDNRVTLSEAYSYAYAQTLRSTLLAANGPQHPTFRWDLSGQREPVLTELDASAKITFVTEEDGTYVIFDRNERDLIAEMRVRAGERRRLALAAGEYVVNKRGRGDVRWVRLALEKHDDRLLYDYQMRSVPMVRLVKKGALSNLWLTAEVGQHATPWSSSLALAGKVGAELEQERWLFGVQVLVSSGSTSDGPPQDEYNAKLNTTTLFVGPQLVAQYTWRFGPVGLRLGPLLAPFVVLQTIKTLDGTEAQPNRAGFSLLTALALRLDVALTSRVAIVLSGNGGISFASTEGTNALMWDLGHGYKAFPLGNWSVGVRFIW